MSDNDQPANLTGYANRRKVFGTLVNPVSYHGAPEPEVDAYAAWWRDVIAEQGASLSNPDVANAMTAIAEAMERIIFAAQTVRHGNPAQGIEPNPEDGLDHPGAELMLDVVRGLRSAAGG